MEPDLNGNEEPAESQSLAGRLVGAGTDRARRAVGVTGIEQALESTIEEALVRAVESEAVERSISRIMEGPVIENAVRDAMRSEAVEQALLEIVDSELIDRLWARILESDETQKLIERIAEAPEVRAAIASQGLGLIDDIGRGVARVTRALDFAFERIARRLTLRQQRSSPTDRAGFITRALALGFDAVIVNLVMLGSTALVGLLATAVGIDIGDLSGAAYAVGGATWLSLGSLYLFVFWSISGQTPGMRFLDIRIEHEGERAIGPKLAFRRLAGFWLAAIPFGLGFLGVLLRLDRRGFPDRLGQTQVFYINPAGPNQPHLQSVVDPMGELGKVPPPADEPEPGPEPVTST